jgi:NAD(P)H-hydrate epimerase
MRVLTAEQMRAADAAAVARDGDVGLMRAAGEAIAEAIVQIEPRPRKLVAFAGPGNNGGDAFAAFAAGTLPCERIVYAMPAGMQGQGRLDAIRRARAAGTIVRPFPLTRDEALAAIAGADIVIDALLGTGARPQIAHEIIPVVEAIAQSSAHVLAIDVPTGVDGTTGAVAQNAVRADTTVTLGALKLGLLLEPARSYVGTLLLGDIGLTDDVERTSDQTFRALDDREFLALLPLRDEEADKRSAGAPLVIAGSAQFPGAAILCTRGAARAGAGYVTVASPQGAMDALRAHLIEQVAVAYDPNSVEESVEALLDLTKRSNAVAIGPGLGLGDTMGKIVRGFLERCERPCVIDASALFHLSKHLEILRGKPYVITPHEHEFARLSGEGTIVPGTRVERLRSFVARTGVTTLLKGNATLIDDGETIHINVTGTSALATAGTGDVLSGIIATLLSQGLSPVDAARAGAYWHGLAGRNAARERRVGVIAGDVAEALGPSLPDAPLHGARSHLRAIVTPR